MSFAIHSAVPSMGVGMKWLVPLMALTACLCKSTGSIGLMLFGVTLTILCGRFRLTILLLVAMFLALTYKFVRTNELWTGRNMVEWTSANLGAEQASSLDVRLYYEDMTTKQAMKRPVFGWGAWGYKKHVGTDALGMDQLWRLVFRKQARTQFTGI